MHRHTHFFFPRYGQMPSRLFWKLAFVALSIIATRVQGADQAIVGLITKTDTNPFFVKMREGAETYAKAHEVRLLAGAGKIDGDNLGQIAALENMLNAGARTILITPNADAAIVGAIRKARAAGILVIALDGATNPPDAVDALFATNNYQAGVLIGQYAKAALDGKKMVIAAMDGISGQLLSAQRHNGFLAGMGLMTQDDRSSQAAMPQEVVCAIDTAGDRARAQTAMENCLQKNGDINVVYTLNEPAAAGAYNALKAAGKEKNVVLVSVDGGCEGVRDVASGKIAATAQQYPLKMAEMGVAAGLEYSRTRKKPSGYVDTGVQLVAHHALAGIPSLGSEKGLALCWGK